MSAHLKFVLPAVAGALMLAGAGSANATCGNGCHGKPPAPSKPHHPRPTPPPAPPKVINNNYNKNINNNNNFNKNINNNNVNVNVRVHSTNIAVANATSNSTSNANATANAAGSARSDSDTFFFSGGGAQVIATPGFPVVQALNVVGSEAARRAVTERRTVFKKVVVQAVCIDDRGAPHPASQIFPERDVRGEYSGEVFRCIAGSRLQATIADWAERVSFDGGETMACAKGEALWHENNTLSCRPARPQRNCYERSLLRRFGVGTKVFQMSKVEEFTSFREEIVESASVGSVALDGGVGGFIH
jgi:hypothetical protein